MSRQRGTLLITLVSVVLQNIFIKAFTANTLPRRTLCASNVTMLASDAIIYIISLAIAVVLLALTHLIVTRTDFGAGCEPLRHHRRRSHGVNIRRMYSATSPCCRSAAISGALVGSRSHFRRPARRIS